ncbi:hypothetical protein BO94DRAFT_465922 [Aspergillus sclerotioniger CBS 115572]|uniref:Uncharacterized protein n=1 Tax=Aspergillus sclerotioniger CBS 115572 TaxID=1450535 RepID=A0A317WLG0_9EURO|nr:hypothetical protein BO94DRAFT_465922 [Aspergillus sclerotioniger CBS 115572]PWY87336.1 hypothetical protein BO94DRAFT_465922 [Aspergillus sclerotioniger CBS 115572]
MAQKRPRSLCSKTNDTSSLRACSECNDFSEIYTDDEEDPVEWSPGDGVCPSSSEFLAQYRASFGIWSHAARSDNSGSIVAILEVFLKILRNVPPFFDHPPKDACVMGGSKTPLILRSSFRLETATDMDCDQHWKSFDYLQCLGFATPVVYNITAEDQQSVSLSSSPLRRGYLTNIILAWSYIISCRWTEILQQAGWKCSLFHDRDVPLTDCFWDIVIRSRWLARSETKKGIHHPPWMLKDRKIKPEKSDNWVQAPPNSSLAFDILLKFCVAEGLEAELLVGLASVLILTSRDIPPPKLSPPITISQSPTPQAPPHSTKQGNVFYKVFDSLDKVIFLSSTQDAFDSMICSAFFDPSVACNLLGASSLGIKRVLFPSGELDNQRLLRAIAKQAPHLSPLWAAAICTNQAASLLRMSLNRLPPLCLPAAFWTNTLQSFLQATYQKIGAHDLSGYRVPKSYFCRPAASIPWPPSPPFGSTIIKNVSLEVKEHLEHGHRPLSWQVYWVTKSGADIPATGRHQINPPGINKAPYADGKEPCEEYQCHERETADGQSWSATSRLFNWHRDYDDGIWLDDGTKSIEAVRQMQVHLWIVNPFDDNGQHDPVEEEDKDHQVHTESILDWYAEVERCQEPENTAVP